MKDPYDKYDILVVKARKKYKKLISAMLKHMKADGVKVKFIPESEMSYTGAPATTCREKKIISINKDGWDGNVEADLLTLTHEMGHIIQHETEQPFCCVACYEVTAEIIGYKYFKSIGLKGIDLHMIGDEIKDSWNFYGQFSNKCERVTNFLKKARKK